MQFIITRVSQHLDDEKPPCEGAEFIDGIRVDRRTVDSPEKIPMFRNSPSLWYKEGRNHRVVDGGICRDFDTKYWVVKIENLEDLIKFNKKYGDLVLSIDEGNPSIEIYDTYRE